MGRLFARNYCRTRQRGSAEWLPAFTMSPFSLLHFSDSIQADSTKGRWRGLDKIIFSSCQPELQSGSGKLSECHVSQLHWKVLHREWVPLLLMCSFLSLTDRRWVQCWNVKTLVPEEHETSFICTYPFPSGCHHDFLLLVHNEHGFRLCASLRFTVAHILLTLRDVASIPGLWAVFSSHQSSEVWENTWSFTLWRQWEIKEHLQSSSLKLQTPPC